MDKELADQIKALGIPVEGDGSLSIRKLARLANVSKDMARNVRIGERGGYSEAMASGEITPLEAARRTLETEGKSPRRCLISNTPVEGVTVEPDDWKVTDIPDLLHTVERLLWRIGHLEAYTTNLSAALAEAEAELVEEEERSRILATENPPTILFEFGDTGDTSSQRVG